MVSGFVCISLSVWVPSKLLVLSLSMDAFLGCLIPLDSRAGVKLLAGRCEWAGGACGVIWRGEALMKTPVSLSLGLEFLFRLLPEG